ncbi:ABC transporter ATP-binding protein [Natrinema gelatinilyticum]|uniref:ABC transporter ATP-binding protein n=1 Tax=Natrinema gelatinilyticum TaxID=2961571 RepID=UPI0020C404E3|nr:ABC transporter ATP-binding protein [Natrinema gelatinilyticum]
MTAFEESSEKPISEECNHGVMRHAGTESSDSGWAIVVNELTKSFGNLHAVDDVSFRVPSGEIFGFIGPNGSGKTTVMKLILGLLSPDSGTVTIEGIDVFAEGKAAKAHVGYLPERPSFYDNLTPVQTLKYFARLKGVLIDPHSMLTEVGLGHATDRLVGTFSEGMTQLLGVAQAMIGDPDVYVFDEPTSALDPRWSKRVREKIKTLNGNGATIFLSSHDLSEVQHLCDSVAIIEGGRLIATDTLTALSEESGVDHRLVLTMPDLGRNVENFLANLEDVERVERDGDTLTVTSPIYCRAKIISSLVESGYNITEVRTFEPTLEDTFIEVLEMNESEGER